MELHIYDHIKSVVTWNYTYYGHIKSVVTCTYYGHIKSGNMELHILWSNQVW